VAGGAVAKVDPDSAGLNPEWRKSIGELVASISWQEGASTADINALREVAASDLALLDTISPGSATYFNEVRVHLRSHSYHATNKFC